MRLVRRNAFPKDVRTARYAVVMAGITPTDLAQVLAAMSDDELDQADAEALAREGLTREQRAMTINAAFDADT